MTNSVQYSIQKAKQADKELTSIELRISATRSMYVVHKAVTKQLKEKRQGGANCKTRGQVQGGGRKPWKQKGTGRARAGSIRSPLWKGGGVIFGPKTKVYYQKINKKEKRLAIRNILFNKKNFTFLTEDGLFNFNTPKTKLLIRKIEDLNIHQREKILIILPKKNRYTLLAARNLSNIEIIAANHINPLSVIKAKYILIDMKALGIITDTYNG